MLNDGKECTFLSFYFVMKKTDKRHIWMNFKLTDFEETKQLVENNKIKDQDKIRLNKGKK